MGVWANLLGFANRAPAILTDAPRRFNASPSRNNFEAFAGAYSGNELIYSAIELLASSASEPQIAGRRMRRAKATVRNEEKVMKAKRLKAINARLVRNGFVEDLPDHPLVQMLNNPNPFMSRGQMWGTVVMDRCLAGNAYLLKVRAMKMPLELWRLRPDRVKVIPSPGKYIEAYEYDTGQEKVRFPAEDVIHFKERNPTDVYYGMPPLMPLTGRVNIDGYMREFLRAFFERGGTGPGAILTVKNRMTQEQKDQIRERAKRQFGGSAGFHEWLVLDQTESTYQQLGLDRGLRDALPLELDAITEARVAAVFRVPASLVGFRIGLESSSYANKRQDWSAFWLLRMVPLLSDMDDVLNLSLVPDFSGIDEVYFDLEDIEALQEDVDNLQDRQRKNFQAGGISLEEFRDEIGFDPNVSEGLWQVGGGVEFVPFEKLGEQPTVVKQLPPGMENVPEAEEMMALVAEPRCPTCARKIGRNIQEGGELHCRWCKAAFTVTNGA